MHLIKINFLDNEVAMITAVINKMSNPLNLDSIINHGLKLEDWLYLRDCLAEQEVSIPNKQGGRTDVFPESVIKKINTATKQEVK